VEAIVTGYDGREPAQRALERAAPLGQRVAREASCDVLIVR
jgi:nucleotide-binding universal stress UspA family protein